MQSRRWVFTLNNPTAAEAQQIAEHLDDFPTYAVVGRETGEAGTPHLQGFVIFPTAQRLNAVKERISNRCHLEVARGTSQQAADYCKKDGDFDEYGEFPANQGKRNDWEEFKKWVEDQDHPPTRRETCLAFPALYHRYKSSLMEHVAFLKPPVLDGGGQLREWQLAEHARLMGDPDDRTIDFVVDNTGNIGKSWFIKYMMANHPNKVQRLSSGKRDDIAFAIDPTKSIFLFDIPRGGMEHLQYSVLEMLKDRTIFSPKYESQTKILYHTPHVVVYCNEYPDLGKLSADRFNINNLT